MPLTKEDAQKLMDEQKQACKKNPGSWTDFTWHDAKIMPNNAPAAVGHDAITAFYKSKKEKCCSDDVEMKTVVDSVINEGPIAIIDGHATLIKGGKEIEKGKFLHVMKTDGSKYKVLRGMHNSDRPAECGK